MTAAGVLTTNWSMLDEQVREMGGQPEDLYPLGRREDPEVIKLTKSTAKQLVTWGNEKRARHQQEDTLVPSHFTFTPKLQPFHLFLLQKDGVPVEMLLKRMDETYFVSDYAKGMMRSPDFVIGKKEAALIGIFSCEQLGVVGWSEMDFFGPKGWEHVKQFGLTECLSDDGPYLRFAYKEQELGEWFRVGHDPISFDGSSLVGSVGHYLRSWNLNPSLRLSADFLVALRLAR